MVHDSPTLDRIFGILRHPHRRHTVSVLADAETPVTLRDVTNEIVDREYDAPLYDVPSDAVRETYLSLVHVHVPMLEDAGLVEYDPDRKRIEATDLGAVRPVLEETDKCPVESCR